MSSYLSGAGTRRQTHQGQPIPGAGQVPNSAGGHAWAVDPLTRLRRFLILGAEGGSYYATEQDLLRENVDCLVECDPIEAVDLIVEVSERGLAPKNDPALFALAYYAGMGHPSPSREDLAVRAYALDRLRRVARIGTHLFHFASFVEGQRGWGRGLRRAVAGYYEREDLAGLAYDAVKYRQRDGWSHRDLLRLAHPEAPTPQHANLYDWITHRALMGEDGMAFAPEPEYRLRIVEGFELAQRAQTPGETAELVNDYGLPREALLTDHLTEPEVWESLLYAGNGMPLTALIRNLPTMTRVGLLTPLSAHADEVTRRLGDGVSLRASRVHPIQVLSALSTYAGGRSIRGSSTWEPVSRVVDALDAAFYASFENVEPTGKRLLLAIDVSGSMTGGEVNGLPGLTPRVASAAMALVTAAVEPNHYILAFSGQLVPLEISPRERLDDVLRKIEAIPYGVTDCALPMLWAMGYRDFTGRRDPRLVEVDGFVTYTDSETWFGNVHPVQALREYRQRSGVQARAVVAGMIANEFTIADPNDAGMLDVVGFDASAPRIVSDFIAGRV